MKFLLTLFIVSKPKQPQQSIVRAVLMIPRRQSPLLSGVIPAILVRLSSLAYVR